MMMEFRRIKNNNKAHPLVRQLIDAMNAQGVSINELCNEVGCDRSLLSQWRTRRTPNLRSLEACFNVLGMTLVPVPIDPETAMRAPLRCKKEYTLRTPVGNELKVTGMKEFCEKNHLDHNEMYRIANTSKTHKGWSVTK